MNPAPPAYVAPAEPFQRVPAIAPPVEPSYVEDVAQQQMYRVRNLATLVVVAALIVIFVWSLNNALDALGLWWDGFVSNLRL